MTTKKIDFITADKTIRTLSVDLDTLSPLARQLAVRILTTDKNDDLSTVLLRCLYTGKELYTRVLADTTGRYTSAEHLNAEKMLRDIANGDPFDVADRVMTAVYEWDYIRDGETGEAYLERHAGYLQTEKYPYLKDAELAPLRPSDLIHALRSSLGLTQAAFSELTGIPKRTLEDWECDRRTPPDWLMPLLEHALATGYHA